MPLIFDSHVHYDDPRFDADRDELLNSLSSNGVGTVVDICAELDGIPAVLELADRYPFVYAAVGVHPSDVGKMSDEGLEIIKEAARHKKAVAIGEIGLDYHYRLEADPSEADPPRAIQKKWFKRQLGLAKELELPVVIHSRDASADTLDIMRGAHEDGIRGVIHCFSGSAEIAGEYLKMNYYLGVGGVVTFKNGKTLREVVKLAPLERILLETDCPYLAPEPHRGERNDSRFLPLIVKAVSELKGVSEKTVIEVTEKNARELYRIQ